MRTSLVQSAGQLGRQSPRLFWDDIEDALVGKNSTGRKAARLKMAVGR